MMGTLLSVRDLKDGLVGERGMREDVGSDERRVEIADGIRRCVRGTSGVDRGSRGGRSGSKGGRRGSSTDCS